MWEHEKGTSSSDDYKAYDSRPVLNGFSLTVKLGEHICLKGVSGCGKTTILRLLAGLWCWSPTTRMRSPLWQSV